VLAKEQRLHNWKGEDVEEFPDDLKIQTFPSSLQLENERAISVTRPTSQETLW
jgi:hypothetical protein